ncbi:MAG: GNAT family N-acetyltransferase [Candidatus Omnitrophota bacterium]
MPLKDDSALVIRKYDSRDRPAVRRICCETALMGEPSTVFFDDDEIFADALTAYFTDYEPESCFMAEYDNHVIGYLLGAKDVRRMGKIFADKITVPLLMKALRRGVFFHKKNVKFLSRVFLSLVKGEFKTPDFSKDYPAILHINISKECRMAGVGSKLINAYLGYLRALGVKGIHLATISDKAGQFFSKQNFQLLFRGERSYFRYFLNKNVPVYIYGMQFLLVRNNPL